MKGQLCASNGGRLATVALSRAGLAGLGNAISLPNQFCRPDIHPKYTG